MMLKRMWKDNPKQVSDDFFNRINIPTWRTMKLMESLLLTMKNNHSSDYSLDKQTHAMCLQAFYETSALQVKLLFLYYHRHLNGLLILSNNLLPLSLKIVLRNNKKWLNSLYLYLMKSYHSLGLILLTHSIAFLILFNRSYKSGISSELLDPGVAFESIFVQESIIQLLEKLSFFLISLYLIDISFIVILLLFLKLL